MTETPEFLIDRPNQAAVGGASEVRNSRIASPSMSGKVNRSARSLPYYADFTNHFTTDHFFGNVALTTAFLS